MLVTLQSKLIAALVLVFALTGAAVWLHHAGVVSGRAEVQAQWDAAKDKQAAAAGAVIAAAIKRNADLQQQFDALSARYEVATRANPPSVSETVAAGVADGSVRLRGAGDCALRPDAVPEATVRARAADAAATQALADRTEAAIAAVRAGDAADARERQLGEQVIALQGVLRAERQH